MTSETLKTSLKNHVDRLCEAGHRLASSPEEAAAAQYVKSELEHLGIPVSFQRFHCPSSFAVLGLLHVALAFFGVLLITDWPVPALFVLGFTTLAYWGEFSLSWHWLRNLLPPSRSSQNVIGRYRAGMPKRTVVLVSALDSGSEGLLFRLPRQQALFLEPRQIGPMFLGFLALSLLTLVAFVAAFGGRGWILSVIDWCCAAVLIIYAAFFMEWLRGRPVPGANTAAGLGLMLSLAERLKREKAEADVIFAALGASEINQSGALEFANEFCPRLPKDALFLHLGPLGLGNLHVIEGEGLIFPRVYPEPELAFCTRRLLKSDERFSSVRVSKVKCHTPVSPAVRLGFGALGCAALGDDKIPELSHVMGDEPEAMDFAAAEQAFDLVWELLHSPVLGFDMPRPMASSEPEFPA